MTRKNSAPVEANLASSREPSHRYVLVPRSWLVVLVSLLVLPWLAVVGYLWWPSSRTPAGSLQTDESPVVSSSNEEPWGKLEYIPIVISPPLEFIPDVNKPMQSNRIWFFNDANQEDVSRFLAESGLSGEHVSSLMSTTRLVPEIRGVGVVPSEDLILGLPPSTRSLIYQRLAECEFNVPQRNAYRFWGASFSEWVGTSRVPTEVLSLVEPLVYRQSDFLYFADIDLITPRITDSNLRRRLMKALFRESTLLVHLHIPKAGNVDAIAAYWGTGGRRMDIRPLLESLGPNDRVDISHFLPVFARRRVYTYRPVTLGDFAKQQQVNCFWAAMNFFNDPPDDRLVDYKTVLELLKRDYYLVHDNFQLGDVFMFADEEDKYYHAAVYIADNILFTKNGDSILSPFVLIPLDRIEDYYLGVRTSRIDHYRLKRFS